MPPSRLERRPVLAVSTRPTWQSHVVVPDAFTDRQCDRIVDLGTRLASEQAGLSGSEPDDAIRLASVSWIPDDEASAWIYDKLAKVAERANRTFGFDLTGFGEDLQFTCYDRPGAFYTWHQDGLVGEVAGRKLSLVVQLSPPGAYDGASVELLEVAEDHDDEERAAWRRRVDARGTVLAFPAFEYHRVTPLRRGVRHSLVCWLSGPPFR